MKSQALIGALCIIFAASLWGLDGVVLTPRLYHLPVPVVVFLLHAVAFAFMVPFLIYERKKLKRITKKEWGSFIWIAIFGGALGTMAITKALFLVNYKQLSVIVILQKLQPLFAILLAIAVLKERPAKSFYAWAFVALLGSYLLTFGFHKPVFEGNMLFIAALWSLLAAFSFGSSTVFGKQVLGKTKFSVATYIRFGLTSLILIPLLLVQRLGFGSVTWPDMVIIIIIALTTGGTAIFIYYYGLKSVTASNSTIYELAFPVTAVALDYFVNHNVLNIPQFFGAALLVGSMVAITNLQRK
jgi:drug/metabolite transporter (DMT)-like permease